MAVIYYKSAIDRGIRPLMSDDERRAQREALSMEKLKGLEKAGRSGRWKYFLNETCGQEEAWTSLSPDDLFEGWFDEKHDVDLLPIWPNRQFCDEFLKKKGDNWRIIPIPIVDWIDEVIPDLNVAGYKLAIFPVGNNLFDIIEPSELADEWENHWKSFAKSLGEWNF